MKSYDINLEVSSFKNCETTVSKYSAKINIDDETSFADLLEFMESVNKVWKRAMKANKSGDHFDMEVIVSSYDGWNDPGKPLTQKSFDRWFCSEEGQDEEGIYLRADTRYTEYHRDMYLGKNVLKDLAFTI